MYTYLVIDDESLIRKGTIKKLAPLEDQITCIGEAENGREGIEKIEELNPDLVILDMQMPVMDGTQLLPYLADHYPELPLIVISGYRDFDYMKHAISAHAIDYILKPFSKEAIQECVLRVIDQLNNRLAIDHQIQASQEEKEEAYYEYDMQMLKNLVLGYHTDSTTISSKRLNFINNTHNLVLLTLYMEKDASDLAVQEWIEENGFGDLALYLPNTDNLHISFLILFIPNKSPLSTQQLIQQITDSLISWLRQQNLIVTIGISQTHEDLQELYRAFQETSWALNQQSLSSGDSAYYQFNGEPEPQLVEWPHKEEFLFRIEAGMSNEVRDMTNELFQWFLSQKNFTLTDAKYYCYHLSDQCRLILNHYLNQTTPTASSSMQNVVTKIFRLDDLQNYYLQFFLNITDMLKSQSIYAVDDVVEKIQIYMQHNYQKNLTQEFMASLFYLNRSYLSTMFKNKTGMKFVDYLNDIRIEKAKELLANPERKMYQIAKTVGYDNVKYFFRIFKKKVGMTPDQFRQRE